MGEEGVCCRHPTAPFLQTQESMVSGLVARHVDWKPANVVPAHGDSKVPDIGPTVQNRAEYWVT
eukprot:2895346-Karenia_brevis.AAC.1